MSTRKVLGLLVFFSGIFLGGYQGFIWYQTGIWTPVPFSILVVQLIHFIGTIPESMPFVSQESINTLVHFRISDLPSFMVRFSELMPLSLFFMISGHITWQWNDYFDADEKYLGSSSRIKCAGAQS